MEKQENTPNIIPDEEMPTQTGKRKWLIAAIVLLVLLIAGSTTWFFMERADSERAEEEAYEILENNYDTADYEAFLNDFPNSIHARSVRERLIRLQTMETNWKKIAASGSTSDFVRFKNTFPHPYYDRLCDIKIDSLDWLLAQKLGTSEAYARYLEQHPEGNYASEAAVAESTVKNLTVSPEEQEAVREAVSAFYAALGDNDAATLCTLITPVMDNFLNKKEATKADVTEIVRRMFNEHIQSCSFTINNDLFVTKIPAGNGETHYRVTFSADQHIERDNEGKTFGSYKAVAELNGQFMLTSLTMQEISQR